MKSDASAPGFDYVECGGDLTLVSGTDCYRCVRCDEEFDGRCTTCGQPFNDAVTYYTTAADDDTNLGRAGTGLCPHCFHARLGG